MDINIPAEKKINIVDFMRRLGYAALPPSKTGDMNFQKRLGGNTYPRFHVYLNVRGMNEIFSIHLDQKKPSYEGSHAHGGEYSGGLVEQEAERIKNALRVNVE